MRPFKVVQNEMSCAAPIRKKIKKKFNIFWQFFYTAVRANRKFK